MAYQPISTITLLNKACGMFGNCSFSKQFVPAHFCALLTLCSVDERFHDTMPNQCWLQANAVAYRTFMSERYARQILNDLTTWGLAESRLNRSRGSKEYRINPDGVRYAVNETRYDPQSKDMPWMKPELQPRPIRAEDVNLDGVTEEQL